MTGEALALKLVAIAAVLVSGAAVACAQTVTLRQGVGGYTGCTTETLLGKGLGKPAKGTFPLRGSKNRLHVRFDIPARLAGKQLVRARLGVFLPAARRPNFFTEIFCHEVVGADGKLDERTDYDNGRRAGAVDSVELFAPPHRRWGRFPWLPPGVPEGGKWIEFNVTPLAEKWLADPKGNRGVVLVPTGRPDGKPPSTWEIDIPTAAFAGERRLRPRLVLEFGPPEGPYLVGMTDGMVQVLDRSTRFAYRGGYETSYRMSMAANELEGFQVVVYPLTGDLGNVRFTWTDLKGPGGGSIPASEIECFTEEWYKLRATRETDQVMFAGKLYEVPDPLVPARPVTVRRHAHTPFYFRVRTAPRTRPGVYKGTITLSAERAGKPAAAGRGSPLKPTRLALEVKVWPYRIAEKWNFHTMGHFIPGNCKRFHGRDWSERLRKRYYDFLMENRFSPTEQYARGLSPRKDLAELLQRGMNTVYLSGRFTGTDEEIQRFKGDHRKVKALAALDYALVYIGDETSKWAEMQRRANLVHAHLPGTMVMIGGSRPRRELIGYVDIYDPMISSASKVYGFTETDVGMIGASQRRGEEFYWYVCVAPSYPYPNIMLEYPPVIGRVLFWMTWKYGVTGFEYYCYNIWHDRNFSADPAGRFPNVKWKADGYERNRITNADGMLFYPGPITSLRFEAVRDGIEEWESHQLLRDCVEGLRGRKDARRHRGLIARAEKLLTVRERIVGSFTSYTTDPAELLAAREELGELLAEIMPIALKTEQWDVGALRPARSAEVRIARQAALRRRMLRRRHLAACEKLKVTPLSQARWDALWPQRVLFSQGFEGPAGKEYDWEGRIVTDNVPAPGRRALAGHAKNEHFARRIRIGIRWDHARAATTTWVKFKYFINKPQPIGVFVFNMTRGDNWACTIDPPVVGKWTQATLNLTQDFRKKGGGRARVRAGDALDDVFIHAGKAGDKDLRLIVDDVRLIGRD